MEPLVSTLVILSIATAFIAGYETNAYVSLMFFALALLIGICMQRAKRGEAIEMRRLGRPRRVNEEGYFLFIPLVDSMETFADCDARTVENALKLPADFNPGISTNGEFDDAS